MSLTIQTVSPHIGAEVIGADLQRSGLFRLVDPGGVMPRPYRAEEVDRKSVV